MCSRTDYREQCRAVGSAPLGWRVATAVSVRARLNKARRPYSVAGPYRPSGALQAQQGALPIFFENRLL